jgi:uncharacterized lipoprotein YddW (UPF0748 family)
MVHLGYMTLLTILAALAMREDGPSNRPRFVLASPLPGIPGVMVDSYMDGIGLAQPLARNRGMQARIIWIDGTANIDRYNTDEKVVALVGQIKAAGFNTIVFDIKPISGQVIYKSAIAPKLTEWKGKLLPADFDPMPAMCRETKAAGLSLMVSLNAFSEGHSMFKVGPGYAQPEHQSVIYVPKPVVALSSGARFAVSTKADVQDPAALSVYTTSAQIPNPQADGFAITVRKNGVIQDGFEDGGLGNGIPTIPTGGLALFGTGDAAKFLRDNAVPGEKVKFDTDATFLPMAQSGLTQYPLMMNPNDPAVRDYELSIAREVVTNYPVDGIVYDDRLRHAGLSADFSPIAQQNFEAVVGKKLTWPDDVFKYTLNQNLTQGVKPGPYYDQWMAWRASVMRDYLGEVRKTITAARPGTLLGMYAGSWYGDYPALGNNYASPKAEAGFWFMSPNYRQSGDAGMVDFVIPGCYYTTATIHEAMGKGIGIGNTVEAAGRMVNRLVRDEAWTYAGLSLIDFKDDPEGLQNALQAACASTQGVMIFDLSHDIDAMWPVFTQAFAQPARPPHSVSGLLADLRRQRLALDKRGVKEPPIIIAAGSSGIGQ